MDRNALLVVLGSLLPCVPGIAQAGGEKGREAPPPRVLEGVGPVLQRQVLRQLEIPNVRFPVQNLRWQAAPVRPKLIQALNVQPIQNLRALNVQVFNGVVASRGNTAPVQVAMQKALATFDAQRKELETAEEIRGASQALDALSNALDAAREAVWEHRRDAAASDDEGEDVVAEDGAVPLAQFQRQAFVVRGFVDLSETPPVKSPFLDGDYAAAVDELDAARKELGAATEVEDAFDALDRLQRALMKSSRELRARTRKR